MNHPGGIGTNRAGTRFKSQQVVDGVSGGTEATAVFVDEGSACVIVEAIIRFRSVCENGGLIISAGQSGSQQRQCRNGGQRGMSL